jgi:hypothetical protein
MSGVPLDGVISRRTLIASGAAGALVGGGWAAGLRATSMPAHPTLSLVGVDSAQIALLDTTSVRVVIALGTPTDKLVDQIPALMTVLRQRIDLLVTHETVLPMLGPSFTSRWAVRHHLVIPEPVDGSDTPTPPDHTRVVSDLAVDLNNDFTLNLRVSPRNEWALQNGEARRLWSITLQHANTVILLAPDTSAAVATSDDRPSLVVTPGPDPDLLVGKLAPGGIAMNAGHLDDAQRPTVVLRTHLDDIARIEFRDKRITLPPWAEDPYSSDSIRS